MESFCWHHTARTGKFNFFILHHQLSMLQPCNSKKTFHYGIEHAFSCLWYKFVLILKNIDGLF